MLRKLLKYEFKATSGFMLLMYGLLLATSVIISIGLKLNVDELFVGASNDFEYGKIIVGVLAFMVVALFIVLNVVTLSGVFFYAISRFKNNLLGSEGYLMHTLPVKTSSHIISKCVASSVWTVLSVVAVGISYVIIMFGIVENGAIGDVIFLSRLNLQRYINMETIVYFLETCVLGLASIAGGYLHIYASMAIGFSLDTNKIAKSIGVYILISIATSIFETILISPVPFLGADVNQFVNNLHVALLGGTVITVIETVIYYYIANYFLSKKLNLQ